MSIDASDLIDGLLNEQARVNSAVDDGDVNDLVADFQALSGEVVGLNGAETVTGTTMGHPPHNWGDGQSPWGYFSWA